MSRDSDPLSAGSSLLSKWKLGSNTGSSLTSGLSLSSGTGLSGLRLGGLGGLSLSKAEDTTRKRKGNDVLDSDVKKTKETSYIGSSLLSTELNKKLTLSSTLTGSSLLSGGRLSSSGLSSLSLKPTLLASSTATTKTTSQKDSAAHKPASTRHDKPVKKEVVEKSATTLPKKRSADRSAGVKKGGKVSKLAKGKKSKEPGFNFQAYETSYPDYNFTGMSTDKALELPTFLPPDQDVKISRHLRPLHDISGMKLAFINAVSASLICAPNFKDSRDKARQDLIVMSDRVIPFDPEFVLKVALYTRKGLNIRTTANFLLALAANVKACRPYMKKYFSASIALPSDWIEVAEIYQAFHDDNLTFGALPATLRRVMVGKFPDFDKYQLAKYNKDSSKKKKKKSGGDSGRGGRGRGRGRGGRGGKAGQKRSLFDSDSEDEDSEDEDKKRARRQMFDVVSENYDDVISPSVLFPVSDVCYDEDSDTEETLEQKTFTLKQLIRKLHIREPVEHVMCLIGKKYPNTMDEFYASRLPGTFEEERAGKRMKLPIPETWETQVSMKGNKAAVWEELIDHKKLPFMAMLRNLRNLIKAGISPKHHNSILHRLTNERQVVNSKQFPFRFFSAFEVLTQLEKDYEKNQADLIHSAENTAMASGLRGVGRGRGGTRGRGGKGQWWLKRREKNKQQAIQEVPYDVNLITRYRKALDTAVKIATVYNVQPIKGRTIIFCDISDSMKTPCTAARGLGKPRMMNEVAVLLGLMCKYSCEDCIFIVYDNTHYAAVDIAKGTILDNMDTILKTPMSERSGKQTLTKELPFQVLVEVLRDRVQVDNLIILSGGVHPNSDKGFVLSDFLKMYRQVVNPNLLYCSVSFAGRNTGFAPDIKPEHDNDIYIAGYSDQILRFIAERGDGGQLLHVENIDHAFNLTAISLTGLEKADRPEVKVKPERPLQITAQMPRWRTARVFISSTFRDMHGERDLLTRFVFPELRERGRKHFINVYEVDLRWGVTEELTKLNRTISLCLQELTKCQFFLGILGDRYGWVPDEYDVPDTAEFDWVREYPRGASVTELEMDFAALSKPKEVREKAFFYIRNNSFMKDVPKEFATDFTTDDYVSKDRLARLKNRVRNSGLEVYDGYPCTWGGSVDMKPIVSGLTQFGMRVLNNLWNAIQTAYPDEEAMLDESTHIERLHRAFVENRQSQFIGRKTLIKQCINKIVDMQSGVLALAGKPGTGKTSLVASLVHSYIESRFCDSASTVLVHIVGAAPGSQNIMATIKRLCHELSRQFGLGVDIPEDYKNLVVKFGELLAEAGKLCGSTMVVVMDGLDLMEEAHQPHNMEWLPNPVPENVVFVLSVVEDEKCHKSLQRLSVHEVVIGGLDMFDKAELVKSTLAEHRKILSETPFNNQLKLITSKKEAPNPLYLKLACEELRVFGVFEKISNKLKSLPQTTPQLLQEVLARLETDHGKSVVATALSLLVCARDGLEAEELRELLSWWDILGDGKFSIMDFTNISIDIADLMAPATFSYLSRSIQGFLNPTGSWSNRLYLAHAEIKHAVRQRYIRGSGADREQTLHKLLAGYFLLQADPETTRSWTGNSTRAFSELPYHLAASSCFHELEEILCDLKFIYTKCKLGMAPQLMEDFVAKVSNSTKIQEKEQARFAGGRRVREYSLFISRNLHILASHPSLTWQQAMNEPETSEVCLDVKTATSKLKYMEWNSKPSKTDPCYLNISSLPQPATCVVISPDSEYFATGGQDCLIRLYNMETGKELRSFRGHADAIADLCFAGKGTLCSASLDNTLCLWHVDDGHRIAVLKGHQRRVNSCAANPSGKVVVSAGWDSQVKLWDTNKRENIGYLNVESPVNCVDFHPEGQLIVTGSWDSTLRIFDIFHKSRKAVLRGHSTSVRDVAYSPSGRHIASAAMDGEVKIWSATNGSQVGNISGHALPINKLTFTPTGQELVTVSDDHKIKVWSGHLGVPLQCLGSEKNGPVTSVALSPTGDLVAAGYHEGHVRVFDVNTGVQLAEVKHHSAAVRAIAYSRDGRFVITGCDNATVMVLDGSTATKAATLDGHTESVLCVTVTNKYIATCGEDFTCLVFNPPKDCKKAQRVSPLATLRGHTAPITSCTFSPDNNTLATASRDSSVIIWDMFTVLVDPDPSPKTTLHACHNDWINSCVWSNTGDFLVTGSNDFNLKIWDVKTGSEKNKLMGHMSAVNSVAYQYGCIVSACSDGQVKVWSHKGTEITTLHGHTQRVNSCDIVVKVKQATETEEDDDEEVMDWSAAPDIEPPTKKSSRLDVKMQDVIVATCSDDGLLRLWKPLQANELASLTGHSDRVVSVATDKSGHVCSCSLDKSVRLWTPELSDERVLGGHDAEITFCVTSLDREMVLTGSRDGIVKIWTVSQVTNQRECSYSYKAHEKSVNTACFVNRIGSKFATGSDDGQIIIWDMLKKRESLFVRKGKEFRTKTPVTALIWNEQVPAKSGQVIFSGEWDGTVNVWNTDYAQPVTSCSRSKTQFTGFYKNWVTKMQFAGQDLLTAGSDSEVQFLNVKHIYQGKYDRPVSHRVELVDSSELDKNIPKHKQTRTWVLDMLQRGTTTMIVDSKGQITLTDQENTSLSRTLKIHAEAITAILTVGQRIFTASMDQTVKIWTENLTQVGQFYCPSPVTSMCFGESSSQSGRVPLICGDQLGNVHQLTWWES